MTRLADLPADLERIIAVKKALGSNCRSNREKALGSNCRSNREKALRERDINQLELARRICAFVAKHPYDFRQWYATATGGELLG